MKIKMKWWCFGQQRCDEEEAHCWICYDTCSRSDVHCKCPNRHVHRACLARWQFESIGSPESTTCRFCNEPLGDWKEHLPVDVKNKGALDNKVVINIQLVHNNQVMETISSNQPIEEVMTIIKQRLQQADPYTYMCFQVEHPITRQPMRLMGAEHLETALYCARVKCARRLG